MPTSRLRRRRAVSLLALAGVGGCGFDPVGEVPFDPPAEYRAWWAATEACSGRRGDFDRVRWFVIEGEGFQCPSGRCAGHWEDDHTIYLASAWTRSELVVRHEILHDLIGRPGHPDPPFGRGCGLTWETWRDGGDGAGSVSPP